MTPDIGNTLKERELLLNMVHKNKMRGANPDDE